MSNEPEKLPKRVRTAPLVPLALAVMTGIVVDRYTERIGSWIGGAIVLAAISLIVVWAWRRKWAWTAALLLAYAAA